MDDSATTDLDLAAAPTATDAVRRGPSSRRAVFGGVLGLGVALPVLAACGSDDSSDAGSSSDDSASDSGSGSNDSGSDSGSSDSGAGGLTTTSEVPVGGGTIFEDERVVVTQPTEGEFKAFSAECTHRGCLVTGVTDSGIDCNCHGSIFSVEDGSVVEGPAEEPLPEMTVTVDGDSISVA